MLDNDELRALWLASGELDPLYTAFVRVLALTGARRSEVSGMSWGEIDFATKTWMLPAARSKNGRACCPAFLRGHRVLKALPRIDGSDLIFSLNGKTSITAFHKIKQRLNTLMPGECRHGYFTIFGEVLPAVLLRSALICRTIEKVLNHTSGSFKGIVRVYQRHDLPTKKVKPWSVGLATSSGWQAASRRQKILCRYGTCQKLHPRGTRPASRKSGEHPRLSRVSWMHADARAMSNNPVILTSPSARSNIPFACWMMPPSTRAGIASSSSG